MSKNLMSYIPTKYLPMIADISDERESGNGYFIYLKDGYINARLHAPLVHENGIKAVLKSLRTECREETDEEAAQRKEIDNL